MLPPPPEATPLPLHLDPLEALARWPADRPVVFLHSGRLDPQWSRFSLLAQPVAALSFHNDRSTWIEVSSAPEAHAVAAWAPPPPPLTHDPFADLDALTRHDPAIYIGHLNYDLARRIESLPPRATSDHGFPDLQFHRCINVLIHDRLHNTWHAVGPCTQDLPDLAALPPRDEPFDAEPPTPDQPRQAHEAAIARGLGYIAAGDLFQVNLAHRFTARCTGSPRTLYRRLAAASPAWYGAYIELLEPAGPPRRAICSTSPELFLKLDADGQVTTRPIKGTRPLHVDPAELRDAEKDAAELNMIIDLLRNDLGRVCAYGSVRVAQPRTVETHPTVHHGVATVTGRLHPTRSLRHLLRATFPGGSVTGAPKVRAMQVIDELEAVRRGPYCGAIGFIRGGSAARAMQLNLAIRTILVDQNAGLARFSVGGGIVADSTPADEYDETLHKAAALLAALKRP